MATHIDPRPYSSSELRRVERLAKKQPTTLVFEDRNRVPIKDDDDSTGADADGGFDDDDEFDYPDIPVDEDDESDFGDESYSPSEDDDRGVDEELIADESSSDDSAAASDMDETSSAADFSTTGCSCCMLMFIAYCLPLTTQYVPLMYLEGVSYGLSLKLPAFRYQYYR